jgi:hypothetical protein
MPEIDTSCLASEKFDIRKLHAHQERRNLEKQKLYEKVLKRVYHRVETAAAHDTQCVFEVPGFVLGMPLYDAYQCSGYIIQKLKNDGFWVTYYHPHIIHLNWSPPVVKAAAKAAAVAAAVDAQRAAAQGGTVATSDEAKKKEFEYKPTGKLFV